MANSSLQHLPFNVNGTFNHISKVQRIARSSNNERSTFCTLPRELHDGVVQHLPGRDRKKLRLSCLLMEARASRRLVTRLYISTRKADLLAFNEVLALEEFRQDVEEIVWDDALLRKFTCPGCTVQPLVDSDEEFGMGEDEADMDKPKTIFEEMFAEQEAIIRNGSDIEAFARGLVEFPNLKRVTLTSEVWRGWNCGERTNYETPFQRGIEAERYMPLYRPFKENVCWFCGLIDVEGPGEDQDREDLPPLEERRCSRAYQVIMTNLLAKKDSHSVKEFVLNTNGKRESITMNFIRNLTLNPAGTSMTEQLFEAIPLTRVDLAIYLKRRVSEQNVLKGALSKLTSLQRMHLHVNMRRRRRGQRHCIDLSKILPADLSRTWKHLTHLRLEKIPCTLESLCNVLAALPNLRRVVLDSIVLDQGPEAMHLLLFTLKDCFIDAPDGAWRVRRPQLTFRSKCHWSPSKYKTVTEEINNFLYRGGESPFSLKYPHHMEANVGWILDDFDPEYKVRPSFNLGQQRPILN